MKFFIIFYLIYFCNFSEIDDTIENPFLLDKTLQNKDNLIKD